MLRSDSMKKSKNFKWFFIAVLAVAVGAAWWFLSEDGGMPRGGRQAEAGRPVPVEAALIEQGPIELRRTFSGELRANAEFVVAPKVGGRIERLSADMADTVQRGQVVAELDNDEHVQAVVQAEAELAVESAGLTEAQSALEIAERELSRVETLRQRGVASETQLDKAKAAQLEAKAKLEVARARVDRAGALLAAEKIRLGYTRVAADWSGGSDKRVVAERFADEGDTVSANTPLLSIVELDPVIGVIFVTEKDYAGLEPGQEAAIVTDGFPEKTFYGKIERISPVFRKNTRQAMVELKIENPGFLLKPGMFIRASVVLDRKEDATIVPQEALTVRDGQSGVFVIDEDAAEAVWRPVTTGIRDKGRVEVEGDGLSGRVATLGQQLLDHGSSVNVLQDINNSTSGPPGSGRLR
ncbi:MAG: efflux RND transporter periplasmic adaptor subunit [Desulfobacterales bacterium]